MLLLKLVGITLIAQTVEELRYFKTIRPKSKNKNAKPFDIKTLWITIIFGLCIPPKKWLCCDIDEKLLFSAPLSVGSTLNAWTLHSCKVLQSSGKLLFSAFRTHRNYVHCVNSWRVTLKLKVGRVKQIKKHHKEQRFSFFYHYFPDFIPLAN